MMTKALGVFLLLVAVQNICTATDIPDELTAADGTPILIFSNPDTGVKLNGHYSNESYDSYEIHIITYEGIGCKCHDSVCACCVGIDVRWLPSCNACVSLDYIKSDSTAKVAVTLNDRELISKIISLKNPIPLCVSIPYVPGGKVCVTLNDIEIQNAVLKACVYLEIRVFGTTVYNVKFDCIHILSSEVVDQLPMLPEINPQLDHHLNLTTVKPAGQ